ncbi:hypothetical protein VHEMI07052 [[Torrubiella] hemipterigena]|uniref:Enoyl reductase (ER) domain-containing protein n=1 Tax=[Torrubiella] hemipterigena TaxID=1531966 RepID=A0A0A1TKY9_9HYPO|nr:hypothetical protein VHEMI07052 [[Torrubiella] hemipterigena]
MTSTRKVVITKFGDVDVLKIIYTTCPPPPSQYLQIKTEYSGFTGGDISMRKGIYPDQIGAPLTPGYCLVGTVSKFGDVCSELQVGDSVAVLTKYDAQAEFVNQPETYCVKIPQGLDHQQVTALVCDWSTAYAMVTETARVTAGQRVFIHGMSGGVGTGLMILRKLQGAEVYGTTSERNHESIRAVGAHPFVYTDKKWMEAMTSLGGADAVFEALGFESFDESYSILTETGILVAFGTNGDSLAGGTLRDPGEAVAKLFARNGQSARRTTFYGLSREDASYIGNLKALMYMILHGIFKVPIRKVWELDQIWDAHRAWGSGTGIGSVVVRISKV